MTEQPSRGNGFRAQLARGAGASPVVNEKRARRGLDQEGLDGVDIPRSEARRGDHREVDRHRLSEESALVRRQQDVVEVQVINLSAGGAMVEGPLEAKLWDCVELELGPGGSIECAVVWIRDDRFGLEFAHETTIDCDTETRRELLCEVVRRSFPEVKSLGAEPAFDQPEQPDAGGAQKRSEPRHPLVWHGILRHDYEWDKARLRNVSPGGTLIECPLTLNPGATVELDLGDAGRFAATVSWSRGEQSGLAFREPFDVKLLARCRPTVASDDWHVPEYLAEASEGSPWDSRWKRLTVDQLRRFLGS